MCRSRAAEHVFRTLELMQSSPVSKSESRVNSNFSTILDAKNRVHEQLGVTGKGGYREKEGLGHKIWKQTQN